MTDQFDAVVIGGGLAGMVAANRAAQGGLRVLVAEKGTTPGGECNARISTGLFHLAWQPLDAPPHVLEKTIVEASGGEISASLAHALAHTSGTVAAWLTEAGIEFQPSTGDPAFKWHVAPHGVNLRARIRPDGGVDRMMRGLYEKLTASGGEVSYGSRALELRRDDGYWQVRIRRNGHNEWLRASNVCLCDGGFQANHELLSRYVGPQAWLAVLRAMPSATGDALRMALSVGAKTTGLGRFYGHVQSADATNQDLWPYPSLDELCTAGVVINRDGTSIQSHLDNGIQLANILARTEDPRGWSTVVTEEQWRTIGTDAMPFGPSPYHDLERLGGTVYFDKDVESLAAKLGTPKASLAEAVKRRYGSQEAPSSWVGLPIVPGVTFTTGGIAINDNAMVIDEDDTVLPGLYAAGSACGGLHGGPRGGYLGGLAVAAITGWIAAGAMARSS